MWEIALAYIFRKAPLTGQLPESLEGFGAAGNSWASVDRQARPVPAKQLYHSISQRPLRVPHGLAQPIRGELGFLGGPWKVCVWGKALARRPVAGFMQLTFPPGRFQQDCHCGPSPGREPKCRIPGLSTPQLPRIQPGEPPGHVRAQDPNLKQVQG